MHRDLLPGHAGLEGDRSVCLVRIRYIQDAVNTLIGKAVGNVFVDIANKPVLPAGQGRGTEAVGV